MIGNYKGFNNFKMFLNNQYYFGFSNFFSKLKNLIYLGDMDCIFFYIKNWGLGAFANELICRLRLDLEKNISSS